jgi:hypothetical protein
VRPAPIPIVMWRDFDALWLIAHPCVPVVDDYPLALMRCESYWTGTCSERRRVYDASCSPVTIPAHR